MPIKPCPCCGHPVPTDELPDVAMSPMQRRIFDIVSRRSPAGIPTEQLVDKIYEEDEDGGPLFSQRSVHVTVYNLNQKLKSTGLQIRAWPGNRFNSPGYRLRKLRENQLSPQVQGDEN